MTYDEIFGDVDFGINIYMPEPLKNMMEGDPWDFLGTSDNDIILNLLYHLSRKEMKTLILWPSDAPNGLVSKISKIVAKVDDLISKNTSIENNFTNISDLTFSPTKPKKKSTDGLEDFVKIDMKSREYDVLLVADTAERIDVSRETVLNCCEKENLIFPKIFWSF